MYSQRYAPIFLVINTRQVENSETAHVKTKQGKEDRISQPKTMMTPKSKLSALNISVCT